VPLDLIGASVKKYYVVVKKDKSGVSYQQLKEGATREMTSRGRHTVRPLAESPRSAVFGILIAQQLLKAAAAARDP